MLVHRGKAIDVSAHLRPLRAEVCLDASERYRGRFPKPFGSQLDGQGSNPIEQDERLQGNTLSKGRQAAVPQHGQQYVERLSPLPGSASIKYAMSMF